MRCASRAWARTVALVSLTVAGCGPADPPSGTFPPVQFDAGSASQDATEEQASGSDLVADGTWLQWTETVSCVQVMGLNIELLTEALALVQLSDKGGGVVEHSLRECGMEESPILGLPTVVPYTVTDHVPVRTFVSILDSKKAGGSYATQLDISTWAVHLDHPETDPMPTDINDPRVFDQDQDGKPAVTLLLGDSTCEMYVVQRATKQWKGTVQSGTLISGGGQSASEQYILQATVGLCAANHLTWFLSDSARFAMLRVDGAHGAINLDTNADGQVTCEEARAYGTPPFNPKAPDNSECASGPPN
jgi:hypothetical protein